MTDPTPKAAVTPYHGATPITEAELLEKFDETIDRCVAGETFVIIRDGNPSVFMVSYGAYQALAQQAKRQLTAEAGQQSRLAAGHASEADSLTFIADVADSEEPGGED